MKKRIRVLIVDDSKFMRKSLTRILESDPGVQVIGSARNGLDGLEKIKDIRPDVITLDIDMPVMDGLETIRHIMIKSPVPIVVLSSMFDNGRVTFDALRLGVVDFVPKPSGAISPDIDTASRQIINRIKLATSLNLDNVRRVQLTHNDLQNHPRDMYRYRSLDYVMALGTTLSGPNTVIRLLTQIRPTLPMAIVVVQEISLKIIDAFTRQFDQHVPWRVEMAQDGAVVKQGVCYISSTERSIVLETNTSGEAVMRLVEHKTEPLNHLFASAADVFQQNTIGVLLTGIGDDGGDGFARIKDLSGITLAQATDCCVYPNLTQSAIEKGVVDLAISENDLPGIINNQMHSWAGEVDH